MASKIRMTVIFFLLMVIFRTDASANGVLKNVKLTMDENVKYYTTYKNTVEEFLKQEKIELNDKDVINVDLSASITEATPNHIKISKSFYVNISINDAEPFSYEVGANQKVGHVVRELEEKNNSTYLYNGSLNGSLSPDLTIYLYSQITKDVETIVKIPYQRFTQITKDLTPGHEVLLKAGEYGEMTTVTRVIYENGVEVERFIIETIVSKNPSDEIYLVGGGSYEAIPTASTNVFNGFTYSKMITMEASAYSAQQPGLSNYTKSGHLAVHGVVAVDPEVIPLGTWLYIEGYGKALASDTGGSIQGNKIDLCYNTVEECFQFGRKDVNVYILE